jgi:hypothetical protein
MKWLMDFYYRRMRAIDMQILWPACVSHSTSLDEAKAAFAMHAFHDRAWLSLGEPAICDAIDRLKGKCA